jgi:SAM-dependent methyltransferase
VKKILLFAVGCLDFALFCNPRQDIFTHIYHTGLWADSETVSGHGSKVCETIEIRKALPKLIKELDIKSILDLPCGDFNWMKTVTLDGIEYIGADIVPDLVARNQTLYSAANKKFVCLDLVKDMVPAADLVLCRDCLVHLTFKDIFTALENLKKSRSKYLLVTTYINLSSNKDIPVGDWRPLNLQLPPFNFPQPLIIINEKSPSGPDKDYVKCLGLWRIEDIH